MKTMKRLLLIGTGVAFGVQVFGVSAFAQGADAGVGPMGDAAIMDVGDAGPAPALDTSEPAGGQGGTVTEGGEAPWKDAQATQPPPPSFLDTTDKRIVDDRPPPTKEQVKALLEMEAEVDSFVRSGSSYRDTVTAILRREYLHQRRSRDQYYSRQIAQEEEALTEARENAIRLFERFIRNYPNDPVYTPDAMFRLGELYFERSYEQFHAAQASSTDGDTNILNTPDFNPTVELYRDLIRKFPDYRRIDGVYYLIGYCLSDMGRFEEAKAAFLNLVCANKFTYDPDMVEKAAAEALAAEEGEDGDGEGEEEQPDDEGGALDERLNLSEKFPSLTLDESDYNVGGVFVDPYRECKPIKEDARFVSETWFRLGEGHFDDYGTPFSIELSIAAYSRILADPEDRNYSLALYKVAWAHYRASNYPEAIRFFSRLVQFSDDKKRETGAAGSQLRPEAIQYLAFSFAYDDWDENHVPDSLEGGKSGIERIQDPTLMPQDREWTPEVYYDLGDVYFQEAKYPDAIAVWKLAIEKWPNHKQVPELTHRIANAYARHNEMEEAVSWRAKLGDYVQGTDWWNKNVDNPKEQRNAEKLAENSLIQSALHFHQEAQTLRRRCVEEKNVGLCDAAEESYAVAAKAYRGYLERYPNTPQAYELRYNLADALYWSGKYEEAAVEYAIVRDSNLDDTHFAESARRIVESIQRLVDAEIKAGRIVIPEEPPAPSGTPPQVQATPMPELVQRLAQAREIYLARVPEKRDSENVREAYDFNNALLLYLYGYWPQAKERFDRIFDERCAGKNADETGRVAWTNLRNMAVALQDDNEVERLGKAIKEKKCTFSSSESYEDVDCSKEANKNEPSCIVAGDLNALQYRRALKIYKDAESSNGARQVQLYEQAATMLVTAVNQNPGDPQAPIALEYAATALERTSRFESAGRLYERIIDEVGPRDASSPEEKRKLDAILANAYFRLAFNANRFFDFDKAVENYRILADSKRFADSDDPGVVEKREDALINAAIILENLQQYRRAAEYYTRAANTLRDPETKRTAKFRVAEMSFKQRQYPTAIRGMRQFINSYKGDPGAGELVVLAYWRIAQSFEAQRAQRDYLKALQDVVSAFKGAGQEPGSLAAEYAAHSHFILADQDIDKVESYKVNPGKPKTIQDYVQKLKSEIDRGANMVSTMKEDYEPILGYRRPTWAVAALVRQGRLYEVLAKEVLTAKFVTPSDIQKQLRGASYEVQDDLRLQIETAVQQVLDQYIRPIECYAVARYAYAVRASQTGSLDNEYTRIAIDRLQAYGDERIAECIAEVQKSDSNLTAYQPGEFSRSPRGQLVTTPEGIAPPPLAPMK